MNRVEQSGLQHGTVCLRTGTLIACTQQDDARPELEVLASAAHELLGHDDLTILTELFSRLGGVEGATGQFVEIVVLSERGSYVVRRCPGESGKAALAIGAERGRLGLLLSAVHAVSSPGSERA